MQNTRDRAKSPRFWVTLLGILPLGILLGWVLVETVRLGNTGFENKSLWDWLELLIIPLFLATAAIGFSYIQQQTELEIAGERREEETVERYIQRMSELLLDKDLLERLGAEDEDTAFAAFGVARALTLTTLERVHDGRRKRYILRFLYESRLIDKESTANVVLLEADFRGAKLDRIALPNTSLVGARFEGASLVDAKLEGAEMISAHLEDTQLMDAKLGQAVLLGAHLERADLTKADLSGADLTATNLKGAILVGTELMGAKYVGDAESEHFTHWPRGFDPRAAGAVPADFP